MPEPTTTTVTSHKSRTVSPYSFPSGVTKCLEETQLLVGEERLNDGELLTLDTGVLKDAPKLSVRLARSPIASIQEEWGLTAEDLSLAVLVEAPFLNLLDVELLKWPDPSATGEVVVFTDYQLPDWVQQAAGRTKVGVSALLILGREVEEPTIEWMPSHKGAILAEWSTALGVPSLVHWFTPMPLTAAARERLSKRSKCPIAEGVTLYVRCDGLLEQKSLEQALEVYIDEDLAQIIHAASPTAAVKAIESQIIFQVLSEMLDSMRDDAANAEELHPDSAGRPLLELLAKETDQTPEQVFEYLKVRGSSAEILALRSHLQALAGTTASAISAVRKGDS